MRLVPTGSRRTEENTDDEGDELVIDLREQPSTRTRHSGRNPRRQNSTRSSSKPSTTSHREAPSRWRGEDNNDGERAYSHDDRDDYDGPLFNDQSFRQRRYENGYDSGGYGRGANLRGLPPFSRSSGRHRGSASSSPGYIMIREIHHTTYERTFSHAVTEAGYDASNITPGRIGNFSGRMAQFLERSARLDPAGQDRVWVRSRDDMSHAATRFRWAARQVISELGSRDFPELRNDPLRATDQGGPTDVVLRALQCDLHFPIPEQFLSPGRSPEPDCDDW